MKQTTLNLHAQVSRNVTRPIPKRHGKLQFDRRLLENVRRVGHTESEGKRTVARDAFGRSEFHRDGLGRFAGEQLG